MSGGQRCLIKVGKQLKAAKGPTKNGQSDSPTKKSTYSFSGGC
jgi:hypothetical protein